MLWLCVMAVLNNAMFDETCTRNTPLKCCFVVESPTFFTPHQQIIHGLSPTAERFIEHPPPTCTCSRGGRQIIDLFNPYHVHVRARAVPLHTSVDSCPILPKGRLMQDH